MCEGKDACLVLDFGHNVIRHGPVDRLMIKASEKKETGLAPAKECPECHTIVAIGYSMCPDCGYVFPPPDHTTHNSKPSDAGILSDQVELTEYDVIDTTYNVHYKRDAPDDAPRTMRVDYWISDYYKHSGWARTQAESWWARRCNINPPPDKIEPAVSLAEAGMLAETKSITIQSTPGDKYKKIMGYELGDKPE